MLGWVLIAKAIVVEMSQIVGRAVGVSGRLVVEMSQIVGRTAGVLMGEQWRNNLNVEGVRPCVDQRLHRLV